MAKKITFSGILTALCTLCMYAAAYVLPIKEFLLCFSSVFIAAIVIECGVRYAFFSYISASLLSFILMPDKLLVVPFIFLLGYYPLVKLKIEQIGSLPKEWVLKYLIFNIAVVIVYFVFRAFISLPNFSWILLILGIEAVFFAYDYALSLCIGFYNRRIKR